MKLWGQLDRSLYGKAEKKEKTLLIFLFSKYCSGIHLLKLSTVHFNSYANTTRQPKVCLPITRTVKILSRIKTLQENWNKKEKPPRTHRLPGRNKLRCAKLLASWSRASPPPEQATLPSLLYLSKKTWGKSAFPYIWSSFYRARKWGRSGTVTSEELLSSVGEKSEMTFLNSMVPPISTQARFHQSSLDSSTDTNCGKSWLF